MCHASSMLCFIAWSWTADDYQYHVHPSPLHYVIQRVAQRDRLILHHVARPTTPSTMASAFSSATIVSSREWTTTDSGCRLHRSVHAPGIQNIVLQGKTIISAGCVLRGDLQKVVPGRGSSAGGLIVGQGAVVGIGKYGFVGERTIIRPSTTLRDGWVPSRVKVRPRRMLTLRGLPPSASVPLCRSRSESTCMLARTASFKPRASGFGWS
jgi:carbonic anhydrase/acetyltransferase-like protein (isoleucine patch superfamily)